MSICFPGTVIERGEETSREFLFGIFSVTKGLMLAQVREITGLDTSAIQNWINRGFIKNPVDKRYSKDHLAGILIINMLRDVMKMENIAKLLTYLSSDFNSYHKNDSLNMICASELYHYICDILDIIDYEDIFTPSRLDDVIHEKLIKNPGVLPDGNERLINVLKIVLVYYASAIVKHEADQIFSSIIQPVVS